MSKNVEDGSSLGDGESSSGMDTGEMIQLGLILFVGLSILVFGFYSAMAMKVSPSASASVTEVEGESGVYEVTVVSPDADSIHVKIEGAVEERVIQSGGGTFRVDAGEDGHFRVVEYYNPDIPILSDWYSSQYVLFDSASEKNSGS